MFYKVQDVFSFDLEVVENLQGLQDDGENYDTIEDIWPDYPSKEDFFFNEDEYQTFIARNKRLCVDGLFCSITTSFPAVN